MSGVRGPGTVDWHTPTQRLGVRQPEEVVGSLIRALVADDNAVVREGLVQLLDVVPDVSVVATCADGDEVVTAAERTHPDVVVLDLVMPRVGGLEAAARLLAVQPATRVVILTAHLSAAAVCEARRLGVAGYLLKDDDPRELPHHIRRVAGGGTAWHPAAIAEGNLPDLTEREFPDTHRDATPPTP